MITHAHKLKRHIDKSHGFLLDPLEFIVDWIVRVIVYLFIPIPLAAEVIVQFRGLILTILFNAALLTIALIVILFNLFTNPLTTPTARANASIPSDGSFISTDIPAQNPLGGQGLSLVVITAGFMDPNYRFFGGVHTGVDFVPNKTYYESNKAYKETGAVTVYATMNGTAKYYVDQYGSHTVEVTNADSTIKTIFMHLNEVFVTTGESITAGKAIGTMGDTGFTTGEHLHYEIRLNSNGEWVPVNPLGYIQ